MAHKVNRETEDSRTSEGATAHLSGNPYERRRDRFIAEEQAAKGFRRLLVTGRQIILGQGKHENDTSQGK